LDNILQHGDDESSFAQKKEAMKVNLKYEKEIYVHRELERSEIWCGEKQVLKQVLLVTKTNAYMHIFFLYIR